MNTQAISPDYKSRMRLRSERSAVKYLDEHIVLPHKRRQKARGRIRSSLRPLVEAKKIIREFYLGTNEHHKLDFSDVQELRVKLIRRDHTLCPEQVDWLNRLDRRIAKGDITQSDFRNEAAMLLEMPNSLPLQHRKDELGLARGMVA